MVHEAMHRTQISLEKWQYQYLVEQACRTQTSISDVIRRLITQEASTQPPGDRRTDSIFDIIGIAEGDGTRGGREHDRHLYGEE